MDAYKRRVIHDLISCSLAIALIAIGMLLFSRKVQTHILCPNCGYTIDASEFPSE